jgi:hypothetical protein
MQSASPQWNAEMARLLAATEQRLLKAEAAVAKQCVLLDALKRRHMSPDMIDQAERMLATLQNNLRTHQHGLQRRLQIKHSPLDSTGASR